MDSSVPAPSDPTESPLPLSAAPTIPVDATPAEPPPLATAPVPASFVFHGDSHEYFRIWIVNAFLSVITLGVFSAWAKVRKRRYLRGNTELLKHRFDYTADPRRILIGNTVVVVIFLAYGLFGAVYPAVRLIAFGVGVALLPWIVVRSLSFNAHHTVWRGMRFRFHPSLSAGVMVYLLQAMLIPLSLGFYYPAWARARDEFRIGRHRIGTAYFRFETRSGQYYGPYLAAGGMVLAAAIIMGVCAALMVSVNGGHVPTTTQLLPGLMIYGAALYVAKHFIFAQLFNRMWDGTRLDDHRFHGKMQTGRWLAMQLGNLGAIIGTCGLLYPWAVVRSTRYALSCLELHLAGPLDTISRVGTGDGSAVGDTAAEFAGLDFGL
jgi:uncharacterized membrane protein YjgN (DUF898 family)